jgi:hypothetical protein
LPEVIRLTISPATCFARQRQPCCNSSRSLSFIWPQSLCGKLLHPHLPLRAVSGLLLKLNSLSVHTCDVETDVYVSDASCGARPSSPSPRAHQLPVLPSSPETSNPHPNIRRIPQSLQGRRLCRSEEESASACTTTSPPTTPGPGTPPHICLRNSHFHMHMGPRANFYAKRLRFWLFENREIQAKSLRFPPVTHLAG